MLCWKLIVIVDIMLKLTLCRTFIFIFQIIDIIFSVGTFRYHCWCDVDLINFDFQQWCLPGWLCGSGLRILLRLDDCLS